MSSTQFQGHLLESRKLMNNPVGEVCGSGAWVNLHECIYTYRGTCALVERHFLLRAFFLNIIYNAISCETFKDLHTSLIYLGFPGDSVVKKLPGNTGDKSLIPNLG